MRSWDTTEEQGRGLAISDIRTYRAVVSSISILGEHRVPGADPHAYGEGIHDGAVPEKGWAILPQLVIYMGK